MFIKKPAVKLIAALVLSFVLVQTVISQVFIANSPRIHPLFLARVKNLPYYVKTVPTRTLAFIRAGIAGTFNKNARNQYNAALKQVPVVTPPENVFFQPIKTGVYAGQDETTKKTYMKIDAGTKVQLQEFILKDGRVVKLMVPVSLLTPTP